MAKIARKQNVKIRGSHGVYSRKIPAFIAAILLHPIDKNQEIARLKSEKTVREEIVSLLAYLRYNLKNVQTVVI